jgi:hypothetical protein
MCNTQWIFKMHGATIKTVSLCSLGKSSVFNVRTVSNINTACGKMQSFLILQQMVHTVTVEIWKVKGLNEMTIAVGP